MLYYTVVQIQLSDGNFKHQDQKNHETENKHFQVQKTLQSRDGFETQFFPKNSFKTFLL